MAKREEREEALRLRGLGKSYSEIRSTLKVSKSSLSLWLKDHPLSEERIRALRDWNPRRIERYRETRRRMREAILGEVYMKEKVGLLPLSGRDLLIGGLFLYWGEGSKSSVSESILSNTNPAVVQAFIYWLEKSLHIDRDKLKVRLQLYSDMNVHKEIALWSKTLRLPKSQFMKPYIKQSRYESISYKRGFGHGTCNVAVYDVNLGRKIKMGLKVLEDYFNGLVA